MSILLRSPLSPVVYLPCWCNLTESDGASESGLGTDGEAARDQFWAPGEQVAVVSRSRGIPVDSEVGDALVPSVQVAVAGPP